MHTLARRRNLRLSGNRDFEEIPSFCFAQHFVRAVHVEGVEPRKEDEEDLLRTCSHACGFWLAVIGCWGSWSGLEFRISGEQTDDLYLNK